MSTAEKLLISAEDYLAGEETADYKHEFLAGKIWGMVGATDNHVSIALNLATILKQKLKGTPCRPFISDMKVRVKQADAFFYPDVLVSCDSKDRNNTHYKEYPAFIAEILSPFTEAFDRGDKFRIYRQLPSLQNYLLINANKMAVDCFTRTNNNDWSLHSYESAEEVIQLPTLDLTIPVIDIYDDIEFHSQTEDAGPYYP
jgi:Uma2 family endonuclease